LFVTSFNSIAFSFETIPVIASGTAVAYTRGLIPPPATSLLSFRLFSPELARASSLPRILFSIEFAITRRQFFGIRHPTAHLTTGDRSDRRVHTSSSSPRRTRLNEKLVVAVCWLCQQVAGLSHVGGFWKDPRVGHFAWLVDDSISEKSVKKQQRRSFEESRHPPRVVSRTCVKYSTTTTFRYVTCATPNHLARHLDRDSWGHAAGKETLHLKNRSATMFTGPSDRRSGRKNTTAGFKTERQVAAAGQGCLEAMQFSPTVHR